MEIEEICLCALQHLLEEMHCIACSSPKTEEEDGTITNDLDKEEEGKDNNNLSTTQPMHRDGWTTSQFPWTSIDPELQTIGGAEEEGMQPEEMWLMLRDHRAIQETMRAFNADNKGISPATAPRGNAAITTMLTSSTSTTMTKNTMTTTPHNSQSTQ